MNTPKESPQIAAAGKLERISGLAAIAASAAPWIGGPIAEIIGGVSTNLKIGRVEQFVKDVLRLVETLHNKATEEFVRTEDFIDIFEKTAQSVANERNEGKRKLYATYILNNIDSPQISYDKRLKCLRLLDQIDARHIDLIAGLLQTPNSRELGMHINTPNGVLLDRVPHLQSDLSVLIHETNTLGLTSVDVRHLSVNMTGGGAAQLERNVTQLGRDLLTFITEKK